MEVRHGVSIAVLESTSSSSVKGGHLATLTLARTNPSAELLADSRERASLSARTAAANKGKDVLVLDMRLITPLYDYIVIATGASRRQMHAIAEDVDHELAQLGDRRIGIEGYESSRWIVQDYGDVIVHVFDPAARDFYSLEELWADAPRVDWERE
jgi:ribosome-associated protein